MDLFEILDTTPNAIIADSFVITNKKLKSYDEIAISISGGADSDIVMDMVMKLLGAILKQDASKKVRFVFFDTGLEYQATKEHLQYLEEKYGVQIDREKAVKPIPLACRQYGLPFLSKQVSEFISRLQRHGFQWEDDDFETLYKKYPRCKAALRWWCNAWGENSRFNISYNKWLKEFMVENPPDFFISKECCVWAKKKVAYKYQEEHGIELAITGIRKAEGGARSTAYKSCFSSFEDEADAYRPIFWYKKADKEAYEETYNVTHSKCYSCYGLKRTGCAGCPFGQDFEEELKIIEEHEPKLYKAVNNIFGKSYEYTRKYREFVRMKEEEKC